MAGLWVRVRDTRTGHEYDVAERAAQLLPEGVEKVGDGEPRFGDAKAPTYAEKAAAAAPAKSAAKTEWVDFAVAHGMPREEAEASTKDVLVETYATTTQEG